MVIVGDSAACVPLVGLYRYINTYLFIILNVQMYIPIKYVFKIFYLINISLICNLV